ncbi:MAG: phosphoglucosamine mutase [Flavobacteriales bacterium]|nr:phosphoglucosamine mutase [Flavobacteriales bacterium]
MTLIKSISGIRGTIGGTVGEGLSPLDVVKFVAAFGYWIKERSDGEETTMIIGRDARISGKMVSGLAISTLQGLGIDVIDLGLSTTPTVEMAVIHEAAAGGIILTASHNPKEWNALKLLNGKGEFISGAEGLEVLAIAEAESFSFAEVDDLGSVTVDESWIDKHIEKVIGLPNIDKEAISDKNFKVVIDCVNSTGGISLPPLLRALGVSEVVELYCEPNGIFPHNPEPLPEHLTELAEKVKATGADVGFSVDPDVDRLAIVSNNGEMFGEEYTLVAIADYVLGSNPGATVSNLSSSRALRDITEKHGQKHFASAVGEVNVVEMMKAENAVIGGEGNGGIIAPELHYGRDALVGIALFLSHLARVGLTCSELRATYPEYHMSKNKIELTPNIDVNKILELMASKYQDENVSTIDGVKIDFAEEWVHLRKSNTEPIIRVYSESGSPESAQSLAQRIIDDVTDLVQ